MARAPRSGKMHVLPLHSETGPRQLSLGLPSRMVQVMCEDNYNIKIEYTYSYSTVETLLHSQRGVGSEKQSLEST